MIQKMKKRILGIDPSITSTGWAVLEYEEDELVNIITPEKEESLFKGNYKPELLDYDNIETDSDKTDRKRFYQIYEQLEKIIKFYKPEIISIEDQYSSLNPKTLKRLSHVRGVCMFLAEMYQKDMYLYYPTSVKKIASGNGRASKEEMTEAINEYFDLGLNFKKENDKADAIGIALSFLFNKKKGQKI